MSSLSCPNFSEAGTKGDGSDWDADQMCELLYQDRSAHRCLDLRHRREHFVPRCSFCPPHVVLPFFDPADDRSFSVPTNVDNKQVVLSSIYLKCRFSGKKLV